MNKVDVVLGLQYGDEGKGKIIYSLSKKYQYDYVMRFNGGNNAGHTIYHNGKKLITHIMPSGMFFGTKGIIGPGCVIDVNQLKEETKLLYDNGIDVYKNLFIARNAHIILDRHIEEEKTEGKIGTTRRGIGPAYRDKYARVGIRAEKWAALSDYNLVDMYDLLYVNNQHLNILCEGAQAFFLDVDWGDYPFVTSSHCGLASVGLNGIDMRWINKVYGVAKAYETYVGSKQFEDKNNKVFDDIRVAGGEFGATTGRPRQVNWLDLDNLIKSIRMNSVTNLILNKLDVLREVGKFKCIYNGDIMEFFDAEDFIDGVTLRIKLATSIDNVSFSESKEIYENA